MITRSTGYTFNVFHGLSTDTKPATGVVNGDKFVEIDTGDKYVFNGEDLQWVSESGGGGSSGGGVLTINVALGERDTYENTALDKTFAEILAAVSAGQVPLLSIYGAANDQTIVMSPTLVYAPEGEDYFSVQCYPPNDSLREWKASTADGTLTYYEEDPIG